MKSLIVVIILSILFNGCIESDENDMVQLDGPILESVNSDGNIEFNGAVTNIGDKPVDSVFIVIVLKDRNGNIINADSLPLYDGDDEGLLYPQQREFFSITLEANPNTVFSKDVEIYYDEVSP
jgi:hypothetical protein